jgi:hypothetical protein
MQAESMASFERTRKSAAHWTVDNIEVENAMPVQSVACSKAAKRQYLQTAVRFNRTRFDRWRARYDEMIDEGGNRSASKKILQRISTGKLLIAGVG